MGHKSTPPSLFMQRDMNLDSPWGPFDGGAQISLWGSQGGWVWMGHKSTPPSLFMQRDMNLDSPWGFIL